MIETSKMIPSFLRLHVDNKYVFNFFTIKWKNVMVTCNFLLVHLI
jgi:hypothetical protein